MICTRVLTSEACPKKKGATGVARRALVTVDLYPADEDLSAGARVRRRTSHPVRGYVDPMYS
jgi:hypothetical protein